MADSTKYTSKIANTRILCIGGTSGIGFATAECLLEHGAGHIILSSSTQAKVDSKIKEIQTNYPSKASRVSGIVTDLSDQANLESNMVALLEKATDGGKQKLDHIVHTAGDARLFMPIEEVTVDKLIASGMVRYFSTIMMCKHARQFMNPGPVSSITLTTGMVSERPMKGRAAPVGFATGLHGICRSMALDLSPIRVNLISPGAVDTELWTTMGLNEEQKQGMLKKFETGMATGRVGQASDLAESYLYCIKDTNITGTLISSNGGALLIGPA